MEEVRAGADSTRESGQTGSLNDILHSALDKVEARARDDNAREKPAKPVKAEETGADELEANHSKPREGGQASAREDASSGRTDQPKADATKAGEQKDAKQEPEQDTPFAPKSWTEAERKAYSEAPKEVQQAVDKLVKNLQAGFTKKAMASAESTRFAEEVKQSFQPHHRAEMQRHGLSEGKVVKELLGLHDQYTRDPVAYVRMIMNARGITPQQLGIAASSQAGAQQGQADPATGQPAAPATPLPPELQAVQQELAAIKGALSSAYNTSTQQKQSQAANMILEFAHKVDGSGAPVNPHFDALQEHMVHIMAHDPEVSAMPYGVDKLQAAYDRAAWMNPAVRGQLKAAETESQRKEWEAERTKKAVSVKPRSGGAAQKVKGRMQLDDALSATMTKFGV
jgi:hypothetical protein